MISIDNMKSGHILMFNPLGKLAEKYLVVDVVGANTFTNTGKYLDVEMPHPDHHASITAHARIEAECPSWRGIPLGTAEVNGTIQQKSALLLPFDTQMADGNHIMEPYWRCGWASLRLLRNREKKNLIEVRPASSLRLSDEDYEKDVRDTVAKMMGNTARPEWLAGTSRAYAEAVTVLVMQVFDKAPGSAEITYVVEDLIHRCWKPLTAAELRGAVCGQLFGTRDKKFLKKVAPVVMAVAAKHGPADVAEAYGRAEKALLSASRRMCADNSAEADRAIAEFMSRPFYGETVPLSNIRFTD